MYYTEMTDTFGGEANYCWCKRHEFDAPDNVTDRQLTAVAKRLLDITGVKCDIDYDTGEEKRLNVRGANVCIFIGWQD